MTRVILVNEIKLVNEIADFNNTITTQSTKISTMQSEIVILKDKLLDLEKELTFFKKDFQNINNIEMQTDTINVNKSPDPTINNCLNKQKILLLADSNGRNCGKILNNLFDDNSFSTFCIFKPNGLFENIVEDIVQLTKNFNKNDHVILFGGTNNACLGKKISDDFLRTLKQALLHTNIYIILAPLWKNQIHFNSIIIGNNLKIAGIFNNAKIVSSNFILEHRDFTKHGLHISHMGKVKLLTFIKENIQKSQKNLSSCLHNKTDDNQSGFFRI